MEHMHVDLTEHHARPGFRPLYLPTDHPGLRNACDYARQQVKASDPADMLKAEVMDGSLRHYNTGKRIRFRCWIDTNGTFHEQFLG